MNLRKILRLTAASLLTVLAGACAGPKPVPDDAAEERLRQQQREERQRYDVALREERQRHESVLRDEQRRHERALRDCQKRAEELQKKLDGLIAIERDMRQRELRQP